MIQAGAVNVHRNLLWSGTLLLILAIPSLYIFLNTPPLWRDEDAFNEIVSPFAPMGIIHFLPGYCFVGRLIVFAGSIVVSLLGGHGLPRLSISATPLTDAGIGTLIVVQHLFIVFSLFYAVRALSDRFPMRVLMVLVFALTPWVYVYANCIGTEGFSNPLVYLIASCGWNCLRKTELKKRMVLFYFGLLLAAALTRHINVLLASGLPIALLPLAGRELILRGTAGNSPTGQSRFCYTRKFLIFVVVGLSAIGTSLLVQQTMCGLFRVPFRSTFGDTFEYRLGYLEGLPEQERTAILTRISAKLGDPVVTEALEALNGSLNRGENWVDTFLYYKIEEILARSGFTEPEHRTWQVDLKLNRIATCVLLSGDPKFVEVVWSCFVVSLFFAQTDLAHAPFQTTDWLQKLLPKSPYEPLRSLASFQHEQSYYTAAWKRIWYVHLLDRIPMLEMACVTISFVIIYVGLALLGVLRDPVTVMGISYAAGLIVVALLISFATSASTYFQPRLYLPLYSLFQMSMLLVISLAANVLLENVASFRKSRKVKIVSTILRPVAEGAGRVSITGRIIGDGPE